MSTLGPPSGFTIAGAKTLKQKIEEYWAARGVQVTVYLQETGFDPAIRASRYDVRSDMIDGLPRPMWARAAA